MEASKTPDAAHLEDSVPTEKMDTTQVNLLARDALEFEPQQGPWAAVKSYPMAIFWSLMVSMCVVMEGMFCFGS
jgi:SP family general alpha glucoside:H+ symporter-like MFS transporter